LLWFYTNSTVVEHLTHNHTFLGLNPASDTGREKCNISKLKITAMSFFYKQWHTKFLINDVLINYILLINTTN